MVAEAAYDGAGVVMRKAFGGILAFASLMIVAQRSTPDAAAENEVRQFVTELLNYEHQSDPARSDRFYADDFTFTSASGERLNKTEMIAAHAAGKFNHGAFQVRDERIRMYENTAVVTSREHLEGHAVSGYFRTVRVLSKQQSGWRLVASQMTRIADK